MRSILLGVFVLGLLAAGWTGYRGLQAKDHLLRAAAAVSRLQQQAKDGDVAGERMTLASLQDQTRAARSETSDPIWRAIRVIPVVGRNSSVISAVAASVDDLAQHALPPLVDASATVDLRAISPRAGRVDLGPLQRAAPAVTAADAAVNRVRAQVDAVSTKGLLGPVRSAVMRLRVDLDSAARSTATAARAVTLVPPMFGADGPRTYAVLFLNNAELRAPGGIPGSWAIIRADHGKVEIAAQGSASDVNHKLTSVNVPADVTALYTDRAGRYFQDVALTPYFPTAAALAKQMLEQATGLRLDGVIATDPVALAELLRATGPVRLPLGGTLTAANAVSVLLSDVYLRVPDPRQQDAFFGQAAKAVFDALSAGQGDARATVRALATSASQGRLSVWSSRPDEQQQLAGTALEGVLPRVDAPGRPSIGVFLDDSTGGKLDYYLRQEVAVVGAGCSSTRAEFDVRITLTSTAPKTALPDYVTGGGTFGVPIGTTRTQVFVYAPPGGAVVRATSDGTDAKLGTGTEGGRVVGIVTIDLTAGATKTVTVRLSTAAMPAAVLRRGLQVSVRLTPLAAPSLLRSGGWVCRNG